MKNQWVWDESVWGKYANDPQHDHGACATCLPERLAIVAGTYDPDDEWVELPDTTEWLDLGGES